MEERKQHELAGVAHDEAKAELAAGAHGLTMKRSTQKSPLNSDRLKSVQTLEEAVSLCTDLASGEDDGGGEEDGGGKESLIEDWEFCLNFVQFGRKWGVYAHFAEKWAAAVVALTRCHEEVDLDAVEKFAKSAGAGKLLSELLDQHRSSAITTKALCSTIVDLTGEYDLDWQEAIGRGQGCHVVVSLMRQYMENPEVLTDLVHIVATLVCDEDGFAPRNRIRFRKAGACELLVDILRQYLKSDEAVRNVTIHAIAGVSANSAYNKSLFGKLGTCPLLVTAARDGCRGEIGYAIANLASENQKELLELGALEALEEAGGWGLSNARSKLTQSMAEQKDPEDDVADGMTSGDEHSKVGHDEDEHDEDEDDEDEDDEDEHDEDEHDEDEHDEDGHNYDEHNKRGMAASLRRKVQEALRSRIGSRSCWYHCLHCFISRQSAPDVGDDEPPKLRSAGS